MILLGEHVFEREHDARELAARGDLVDGLEVLARVRAHEEAHRVNARRVRLMLCKVDGKADLVHVQLAQLPQNALLERFCRSLARVGKRARRGEHFLFLLGKRPLKLHDAVVRVFDLVKLLFTALEVIEHLADRRAVLFLEAVELVGTALHRVELLRGKVHLTSQVAHRFGEIVNVGIQALQPLAQLGEASAEGAHTVERVLRVLELARRAEAVVPAGEGVVRRGEGVHELFGVAQQLTPRKKLLLLAVAQLRALQLGDLMAQRVDAAGLFRLVHFKRLDLPPGLTRRLITLGIGFRQAVEPGEAVEVRAVLLLVEQLRALVLAVDIQKARPQRAQLRDCDGPSVRAADVLAVGIDVALEQQHAVLRLDAERGEHRKRGVHAVKFRADEGLGRARADQVARGARAEHRAERVDDDGLARAGLTGERVEARAERDVRALDDGDVFDVEKLKHCGLLPFLLDHGGQLSAEFRRTLLVAQHDEHRVVAADRADDSGDLHAVEGGACRGAEARHHLHHDEVLRTVGAEDALAQDDLQSAGKVELDLLRAHGVAVAPAADWLLDEVELLDVA